MNVTSNCSQILGANKKYKKFQSYARQDRTKSFLHFKKSCRELHGSEQKLNKNVKNDKIYKIHRESFNF